MVVEGGSMIHKIDGMTMILMAIPIHNVQRDHHHHHLGHEETHSVVPIRIVVGMITVKEEDVVTVVEVMPVGLDLE
jgi:hypothetical protein